MTRIVAISDTHGHQPELPEGDVLIHAGDLDTMVRGDEKRVLRMLDWLAEQPHRHKILVAGNYDQFFERAPVRAHSECSRRGIVYLRDSFAEVWGRVFPDWRLKIWGSPWVPKYGASSFMKPDDELEEHWASIHDDIDVLVTHGPPYAVLDQIDNVKVGSKTLRNELLRMVMTAAQGLTPEQMLANHSRRVVHIFGHIHEGYGHREERGTGISYDFYNVAICDNRMRPRNPATVIEV